MSVSEKYSMVEFYWIMIAGIIIGVAIFNIYFIINESQFIDKETMDEVCTQLSGQPSVFNYQESTSKKIICNPIEKKDEKVLDDGKIVLKGYKQVIKVDVKMGPKDNEEGTRVTPELYKFSNESTDQIPTAKIVFEYNRSLCFDWECD